MDSSRGHEDGEKIEEWGWSQNSTSSTHAHEVQATFPSDLGAVPDRRRQHHALTENWDDADDNDEEMEVAYPKSPSLGHDFVGHPESSRSELTGPSPGNGCKGSLDDDNGTFAINVFAAMSITTDMDLTGITSTTSPNQDPWSSSPRGDSGFDWNDFPLSPEKVCADQECLYHQRQIRMPKRDYFGNWKWEDDWDAAVSPKPSSATDAGCQTIVASKRSRK